MNIEFYDKKNGNTLTYKNIDEAKLKIVIGDGQAEHDLKNEHWQKVKMVNVEKEFE